jgi:hypothetical protein
LIAPDRYRSNEETAESNVFQQTVDGAEAERLAAKAIREHRALRDLLIENGVRVTVARALAETPDAPFCNNWFSTHEADGRGLRTVVLYPMLAPSRRLERRPDLSSMLTASYPNLVDLSDRESAGTFLESTGSLCLDHESRTAFAAISPRTDLRLAREWATTLGYRLVPFQATDEGGVPYYHTNVMMFVGHGLAGVCLESVAPTATAGLANRGEVEASLRAAGLSILPITRQQVLHYCGNCLALRNDQGQPLWVMSAAAFSGFSEAERATMAERGRIIQTDLTAFETLGGGSARCLLGELF